MKGDIEIIRNNTDRYDSLNVLTNEIKKASIKRIKKWL